MVARIEMGAAGDRFRRNIRAVRLMRNYTLDDVADRMGAAGRPVVRNAVWRMEQGTRRPDADDMVALAAALDVDIRDLLMRSVKAPDQVTFTDAAGGDS